MHLYLQEELHTFLLHAWKETPDSDWQFTLKDVSSQEQRIFVSLEQLVADLRVRFAEQARMDGTG